MLANEEGIMFGFSGGSAMAGLLQLKAQLTKDDVVVIVFHDHGSRYLGKIYNDDWMRERGFLEGELKVQDLVEAKNDKSFYSVNAADKVRDVLNIMKQRDISQLPVMENGEVIGTVSENSILAYILENPMQNADKEARHISSEP